MAERLRPSEIGWAHYEYSIHHSVHASLNAKQRQSVQHFGECARRLVRRRDDYAAYVATIPLAPLGFKLAVTPEIQEALYDKAHSFFDQFYATVSALMSVNARVKVFGSDPPIRSVESYLRWWVEIVPDHEELVDRVIAARDFRTLLQHPQQFPVYDWGTVEDDGMVSVVLHGAPSGAGNVPNGSTRVPGDPERWNFHAPDMDQVVADVYFLLAGTFHTMPGTFPLRPHEETCTIEDDRRKAARESPSVQAFLKPDLRDFSDPPMPPCADCGGGTVFTMGGPYCENCDKFYGWETEEEEPAR